MINISALHDKSRFFHFMISTVVARQVSSSSFVLLLLDSGTTSSSGGNFIHDCGALELSYMKYPTLVFLWLLVAGSTPVCLRLVPLCFACG